LQLSSKYSKCGPNPKISQEQINQLIRYIVNDKMSVNKASQKVKMSAHTGYSYYNAYINDPETKIPVSRDQVPRTLTQEQIGNLIRYMDNDKMNIREASAKADMSSKSGNYYYAKYLKDSNHNIPIARLYRNYTQDQNNEFIGYIISDKMSRTAASKKSKYES
jgi:hypothetical protein